MRDLRQRASREAQVGRGEVLEPQLVAAQGQSDAARKVMRRSRVGHLQLARERRQGALRVVPQQGVQAAEPRVDGRRARQLRDGGLDDPIEQALRFSQRQSAFVGAHDVGPELREPRPVEDEHARRRDAMERPVAGMGRKDLQAEQPLVHCAEPARGQRGDGERFMPDQAARKEYVDRLAAGSQQDDCGVARRGWRHDPGAGEYEPLRAEPVQVVLHHRRQRAVGKHDDDKPPLPDAIAARLKRQPSRHR